jgi:hypothetical protein
MTTEQLSIFESNVLDTINNGYKTIEAIEANINFDKNILQNIISSLTMKNIIKYDNIKQQYDYDTHINGEKIILTGNILLPVTIIHKNDKVIVTRGEWYEFPKDFDFRRIIWNVQLPNKTKSTLIELIKESVLKERKTKLVQVPEYKHIVGKYVPYNNNIKLKLNVIGEELTDITIIFMLKLKMDDSVNLDSDSNAMVEFREFSVKSMIQTKELIEQLTAEKSQINFEKIKLNRIFNFSDFVFLNNSFPISFTKNKINFVKITNIKQKLQLTYYDFDSTGSVKKTNVDEFQDIPEGINYLKEVFDGVPKEILLKNNFLVESDSEK